MGRASPAPTRFDVVHTTCSSFPSIEWDYSQPGAYFVTICTAKRESVFGSIVGSEMHLNTAGRVVERTWDGLPNRFPTLALDAFVVMPNHIHGIVCLVGAGLALPSRDSDVLAPPSLSHVVGAFKSLGAIAANRALSRPGRPLWQRNYFEHIIRNDNALRRIREYIATNPARWAFDGENPDRSGDDEFDRWLSDRADAQR